MQKKVTVSRSICTKVIQNKCSYTSNPEVTKVPKFQNFSNWRKNNFKTRQLFWSHTQFTAAANSETGSTFIHTASTVRIKRWNTAIGTTMDSKFIAANHLCFAEVSIKIGYCKYLAINTCWSPSVVQWLVCLPLDSRFTGSNPAEDNGFLMAIKIHSTTSFGGEVKLSVPRSSILWHVKEPYRYKKRYLVGKIHGHFSPSFSCFTTRCLCWLLPDSSGGWIRNDQNSRRGCTIDQKWSQCLGHVVQYHPVTVTHAEWCSVHVFSK
jgi:hypothetical protein